MDFLYDLLDQLRELPRRAKLTLGISVGVVVLVLAAAIFLLTHHKAPTTSYAAPESTSAAASTQTVSATPTASPAVTEAEPVSVATVLPETADAGRSYVDETLFIGDSNTVRYTMYADETGTAFTTLNNNIGVVSMGAQAITTLKCEQFKGDSNMYTIPDAVAKLKPRRIVICFGTNNLSGTSTDASSFISNYLKGLQAIQTAWPYADIIVSAIPPLDKQRENTRLDMVQVDAYNEALIQMCEENGFKFLNSAEVLKDPATGWAKKDYTLSDGVHLSKEAVTAYFNYVRTHAYVTEDRRPQPLGSIPTPAGTPANLITQDPIAVRGAKVPVEFVATTGGTLSGSTSQLVKKGGTASAVTAVPASGYQFDGWTASTGDTSGSTTISFTVPTTADAGGVVVTAHFTPAPHEHDYEQIADTVTPATCLTGGHYKSKCSICGDIIETDTPALGHDWDEGTLSKDGLRRIYRCRREGCDATKEVVLATPSPSPSPTPTPTNAPTQTPTHTHDFSVLVSETKATCTENGSITYKCSGCDQTTTESVAALGHSWDGATCSRCGAENPDYKPAHTHDFSVLVSNTATCTEGGIATYKCSGCDETTTKESPALGHDEVRNEDGSIDCQRCHTRLKEPDSASEPESPSPEDSGGAAEGGEDTGESASSEAPSDTEEIPAE